MLNAPLTRGASPQIQGVPVLPSLYSSLISFSSSTFPGASYRFSLLFLPFLPCHFYLVVR